MKTSVYNEGKHLKSLKNTSINWILNKCQMCSDEIKIYSFNSAQSFANAILIYSQR